MEKSESKLTIIKNAPLSVKLLGGVNCFILGLASLFLLLFLHASISSSDDPLFLGEVNKLFSQGDFKISLPQLKAVVSVQIIISLVYLVSGLGLLLKKEWARRATLYFSFFKVALAVVSTLANPAMIKQAILPVAYAGFLIFYFTGKKAEEYFVSSKNKEEAKS